MSSTRVDLNSCGEYRRRPQGCDAAQPSGHWAAIVTLFLSLASVALAQNLPSSHQDPGKAIDTASGSSLNPFSEAKALVDEGSLERANHIVRHYLAVHADSAEGHFLLGLILFKQGKPTESLLAYTEGARHHDPEPADLKIVALNYVLLADYASADHWLTRSLESNPKDSQAWYYLGRTKYNENRFDEALSAFQQCLKLDPKNIKAEDNLGLSHQALGHADEALAAFRTAIAWQAQLLTKNSGPFINIGILLLEQNKVEDAVVYLSEAVQISPEEPRAHEQLGKAYSRQNDLPKAQAELERAVSLSPDNAALHFILGQLYRKQGMNEKAKAELERGAALKASGAGPKIPPPD